MSILTWDVNATDRKYSSGVDHVSIRNLTTKIGHNAWAWNGVTAINDNITGGESTKIYADNISYLNLTSDEEYGCTIESLQEPDAFAQFDGKKELAFGADSIFNGIKAFQATQQVRNAFGLIYRTWYGDDDTPAGSNPKNCSYHFIYNCKASPASNEHATVNETPEAATHSREITTTKQSFDFISWGMGRIKTAHIEIDCRGLSDLAFSKVVAYVEDSAMPMPDAETFKEFLDPNENIVGVEVDYENGTIERIGDAVGKNGGNDFDSYKAFGGRRRCNLADDGTITAWYGDANYTESGENGQVMVYQPAFYYRTVMLNLEPIEEGGKDCHIRKAQYLICDRPRKDFHLYPAFYNDNNDPVPYILIGAYEGCMWDVSEEKYVNVNTETVYIDRTEDLLCSVGCSDPNNLMTGKKPISALDNRPEGSSSFNIRDGEKMAEHHNTGTSTGWHLQSFKAYSMLQYLTLVEYASFSLVDEIGRGVIDVDDTGYDQYNNSVLTGSTFSLGNSSGRAAKSINNIGTEFTEETENGLTSVAYRGEENPYGNMCELLIGAAYGRIGGVVACAITNDLRTYTDGDVNVEYKTLVYGCPQLSSSAQMFIKAFGCYDGSWGVYNGDWVFVASEVSSEPLPNSLIPTKIKPYVPMQRYAYTHNGGGWYGPEDSAGLYRTVIGIELAGWAPWQGARIMYIPNN